MGGSIHEAQALYERCCLHALGVAHPACKPWPIKSRAFVARAREEGVKDPPGVKLMLRLCIYVEYAARGAVKANRLAVESDEGRGGILETLLLQG